MTDQPQYLVTAASGELGRRVVAELAARVGPAAIAAIVRDPARAAGLFPAGVAVRAGDYEKPDTLAEAFRGGGRLLLISSNAIGLREPQHRNAVEAAKAAGVSRIAYTSVLRADSSPLGLAAEHRATEAMIVASGIPHSLLRNGWYSENYAASIAPALQHGAFIGAAQDGRVSGASRQDYAEAAVAALTGDTGARVVHELAGDASFSLAEFAAELSRQAGRGIPYVDMPRAEYEAALLGAGLPPVFADLIADSDAAAANGALFDEGGALSRLIGRPTTPFAETIAEALAAQAVAA